MNRKLNCFLLGVVLLAGCGDASTSKNEAGAEANSKKSYSREDSAKAQPVRAGSDATPKAAAPAAGDDRGK